MTDPITMSEHYPLRHTGIDIPHKATAQNEIKDIQAIVSPADDSLSDAAQTQVATIELSTPTWKSCASFDRFKQVEIRELAVRHGLICLDEIEKTLKQHRAHMRSSASRYLERIDSIRKDKKECRIMVGVMGASGAGKSSLLNALLESKDILPVDDERACTATCVEISWNQSEDTSSIYIAKINRISREEWEMELQRLFKDIQDDTLNLDGENGEVDLERNERIKTAFQKLRCVYPNIRSKTQIADLTVENLLEHPNVKNILGRSKSISSGILESFSAQIKPYIDSSSAKENDEGKSFAQWPLVKLVQLQLKAEILRHGIVLVDLPGNMDTNATRSAIADNYQKNLTMTCVVAPTSRAATDKPAQDLLGRITQRNLLLDNRFSQEHICFIITKTDSSLDVERYIRTHSNIEADLKGQLQRQSIFTKSLKDTADTSATIQSEEAARKQTSKMIKSEIKEVKIAIRKAQKERGITGRKRRLGSSGQESANSSPSSHECDMVRKLSDLQKEASTMEAQMFEAIKSLNKGHRLAKNIEKVLQQIESSKIAACIQNRNKLSTEEITKDFNSVLISMGQDAGDCLQVFCVSALVFEKFAQNENAAVLGFRSAKDSGIPALSKYLLEATLPCRDRNALSLLESLISFELFITPWFEHSSAEYKMNHSQQQALLNEFEKNFEQLGRKLSMLNAQISQSVEGIVETELWNFLAKTDLGAAAQAERTVKGWAQKPVFWSTHRAINRNFGTWKSSNGIRYDWNDDLAGNYLDLIAQRWSETLHKNVPALRQGYITNVCQSIERCVETIAVCGTKLCAELFPSLQQWKKNSDRVQELLKEHTRSIFDDTIQDVARDAHRLVKPKVLEMWEPVYEQCGREHGTGHFGRNQQTHLEHVGSSSIKMFRSVSLAIHVKFKTLWGVLPGEFQKGTECAMSPIRENFGVMMDKHTLDGSRDTTTSIERDAKDQARRRVFAAFDELKKAWSIKPKEIVEEELTTELEEKEITLEDLYNTILDDDTDDDGRTDSDESESDEEEEEKASSGEEHEPGSVTVSKRPRL